MPLRLKPWETFLVCFKRIRQFVTLQGRERERDNAFSPQLSLCWNHLSDPLTFHRDCEPWPSWQRTAQWRAWHWEQYQWDALRHCTLIRQGWLWKKDTVAEAICPEKLSLEDWQKSNNTRWFMAMTAGEYDNLLNKVNEGKKDGTIHLFNGKIRLPRWRPHLLLQSSEKVVFVLAYHVMKQPCLTDKNEVIIVVFFEPEMCWVWQHPPKNGLVFTRIQHNSAPGLSVFQLQVDGQWETNCQGDEAQQQVQCDELWHLVRLEYSLHLGWILQIQPPSGGQEDGNDRWQGWTSVSSSHLKPGALRMGIQGLKYLNEDDQMKIVTYLVKNGLTIPSTESIVRSGTG